MGNKRPAFEPGTVYHVYNHGNAGDDIFQEEENYRFFLKRYLHYIRPVARTYAFCLMPNHFHFMVKIREEDELQKFYSGKNPDKDPQSLQGDLIGFENLSGLISRQFSNFLNAYSNAFNKKYNRKGKLFRKSLNRKPVTDDIYFTRLIYYIHLNPIFHGFVEKASLWPYSSYHLLLSRTTTQLEREEVLQWFGGRQAFINVHRYNTEVGVEEFY